MKATILHNPRCSKSREALALLHDRGVEVTVIEYLKAGWDEAHLRNLLERMKASPSRRISLTRLRFMTVSLKPAHLPRG